MPSFESPGLYIDFSRLPAPKVIEELDFEEILARYKADVLAKNPELERALSLEQSPTNIILQAEAYGEMIVRARINAAARAVMLPFATGSDLDAIGARFNVQRLIVSQTPQQTVYEDDERFRRRIQLSIESFSTAGTAGSYIFHALTADPTLKDASALMIGPGRVQVSLMSADEDNPVASEEQVARVRQKLFEPNIRPLTDEIVVAPGERIEVDVLADVILYPGPNEALVMRDVQTAMSKLKHRIGLLGRDLMRTQIITAISQEGVHSVDLKTPAQDVTIDPTKFITLRSVTINVVPQRKE